MTENLLARYELARGIHKGQLATNDVVLPHWIGDGSCFWYKRALKKGREFRLVDVKAASNEPAFDHKALAGALAKATGKAIEAHALPLKDTSIALSPLRVRFTALGKDWQFEPDGAGLAEAAEATQRSTFSGGPMSLPLFLPADQQRLDAPDGKTTAFIRDHNIWLRDLATGKERALTEDGTHDLTYASNRSLGIDTAVHALWSPDSKRLFTIRRDIRKVEPRTVIHYVPRDGTLRPQATEMKQPRAFEEHVELYELGVIDVASGKRQPADYPAIPLTRVGPMVIGFFRAKMGWWSPDNRHAFFIDVTRGAKAVRVVRWDTQSGATKVVFEEASDTFVRLCHESNEFFQHQPLPDSDELIWFSERSGRAHLYLYDLGTGKVKNAITSGDWLVRDVLHVDAERRELLVRTAGRDPKICPYYQDICKVHLDSGALTPVATGNFEHVVHLPLDTTVIGPLMLGEESADVQGVSPSGEYLLTTRSRVDTVPETVVIDRTGRELLLVEKADVSALPKGWQWPEPVKLKGADGTTDIHGVLFRPPGFSPDKSYPVVEFSNATRRWCGFPRGSFQDDFDYRLAGALAALGFVVATIDGRGAPLREKAFAEYKFGDFGATSDFEDRIAALRQLAERYPYMDLDRVGVTSPEHPTNAVYSVLKHSDFYKVCVQHCLTDPRFIMALDEQYNGTVDAAVLNAKTYPEHHAESFNGKLLLIVGMISQTATDSSFRLVEALQKANKDFDMLCMPQMHHEMTSYTTRREWDYLVRHLQGVEPPKGFAMKTAYDEAAEVIVGAGMLDLVDYE